MNVCSRVHLKFLKPASLLICLVGCVSQMYYICQIYYSYQTTVATTSCASCALEYPGVSIYSYHKYAVRRSKLVASKKCQHRRSQFGTMDHFYSSLLANLTGPRQGEQFTLRDINEISSNGSDIFASCKIGSMPCGNVTS